METATVLHTLPYAVHGQRAARMSDSELVQFEAVLDAANDAVIACEAARREAASARTLAEAGLAEDALSAIVRAVSALTDAPPPEDTMDKAQLVRWAVQSIVTMKDSAVRTATQTRAVPGMDPQAVGACLELISTLNRKLGGEAP